VGASGHRYHSRCRCRFAQESPSSLADGWQRNLKEATTRLHGERRDFGYNVAIMGTYDFVTGINTFTGGVPDSETLVAPLRLFHDVLGFYPDKYIYSRGAVGASRLRAC
jgi:hypothetical protein